MKRLFVLTCGVAAWVLAAAGMLAVNGSERVAALQKSIGLSGASPWPVVVLSATVLLAGLSTMDNLTARTGNRRPLSATTDVASPVTIAIICCLGLLVSLGAAIFGLDLSEVSSQLN